MRLSRSSRTPPGVRELKLTVSEMETLARYSRTPPGVRELKLVELDDLTLHFLSHPSRGA